MSITNQNYTNQQPAPQSHLGMLSVFEGFTSDGALEISDQNCDLAFGW